MKKYIAGLILGTALSVPTIAQAEFRRIPPWQPSSAEVVDCRPNKLEPGDRDPVIMTHVEGEFNESTGDIQSLSVIHELFSGEMKDRSEQYRQLSLSRPDNQLHRWVWVGVDKKKPNHTTVGEFRHAADGRWHYDEDHFDFGSLVYRSTSTCHYLDGSNEAG